MAQDVGEEVIDYYAILGISEHSTSDQVRLAWKDAARRHHPDRGGDPALFAQLSDAHECLSDPKKRAAYDLAFRALSSMRCACGKAKLPGSDCCTWCSLRQAQDVDEQKARARAQARREKVSNLKAWFRGEPREDRPPSPQASSPPPPKAPPPPPRQAPPPPSSPPPRSRPARRQEVPRVKVPSPEEILDSILADVAVASGVRDAGLDLDVRLQVDPKTGKVRLSGKSVDAINGIRENIEIASEMLQAAQRFMGKT